MMCEDALSDHERTMLNIAKAQRGDDAAMELLVTENTALVKSIIRRFLSRGAEYDDLYQLGCMGLVKAIRNFNTDYGVRFSTYAVPMIAGEIKRFLRDDGIVKVSRSLRELAAKAAASQERLSVKLGRDPGIEEIAADIGEEAESIIMAFESARPCVSLYEPAYTDDQDSLVMDRLTDGENETTQTLDRVMVKELMRTLTGKERQLIMMRYFDDKTQSEIAKKLGVSQVQISRLESKIISKLRGKAQ